ncbi:MAG: class II aldolase/adducin family protein [Lentimicrobiaceae bacterium]|jgi:ribulose-5-phosphate 4-epimerase/fuculose-1-phosphate aldolase|nr:class II aldolase/adducin family protein [Lentimicrobiaceae bacterium]
MIAQKHIDHFIKTAHYAGNLGLVQCSSGNLSYRVGDKMLVSATGSWLSKIRENQIAIIDLQNQTFLNNVKPSMEWGFHIGVMKQRHDVNVVLHFQSPYATSLACATTIPENFNLTAEIPCHIGDKVAVVLFLMPGSPELAQAVTKALAQHDACLLRQHGQVVCAATLEQAIEKAVFFEMACRIMLQTNLNYNTLTEKEVGEIKTHLLRREAVES